MIYNIGDLVEWRDQTNYPGLCGIVTQVCTPTVGGGSQPGESWEIFVHWTNFPKDYGVGAGWEEESRVRIISAITKEIK